MTQNLQLRVVHTQMKTYMRKKVRRRSHVHYVADMVFMQDIHVTDAEEQERLWLIMLRHVLTLMSPSKDGLSFMEDVTVGAVVKFMSTSLGIQSVLIVLHMDALPPNSIIRKNIDTSEI